MTQNSGAPAAPTSVPEWYRRRNRIADAFEREGALSRRALNRALEIRAERAENQRRADDASQAVRTHRSYLHGEETVVRRFPEPPGFAQLDASLAEQLAEAEREHQARSKRATALGQLLERCDAFLRERGLDPSSPIPSTGLVQRAEPGGFDPVHPTRTSTVVGA